jgi:hypothetical protein
LSPSSVTVGAWPVSITCTAVNGRNPSRQAGALAAGVAAVRGKCKSTGLQACCTWATAAQRRLPWACLA